MSITFQAVCKEIVDAWNKEKPDCILHWQDLWEHKTVGKFPLLYLSPMHEAAKSGDLVGLLLTNEDCAKIFCELVVAKEDGEHEEEL
tara:strand:- start:6635 stop:6895 length:261 start_codon:yes stop_codon:yes gene_type:complete